MILQMCMYVCVCVFTCGNEVFVDWMVRTDGG